jgi:hypothetical protein
MENTVALEIRTLLVRAKDDLARLRDNFSENEALAHRFCGRMNSGDDAIPWEYTYDRAREAIESAAKALDEADARLNGAVDLLMPSLPERVFR